MRQWRSTPNWWGGSGEGRRPPVVVVGKVRAVCVGMLSPELRQVVRAVSTALYQRLLPGSIEEGHARHVCVLSVMNIQVGWGRGLVGESRKTPAHVHCQRRTGNKNRVRKRCGGEGVSRAQGMQNQHAFCQLLLLATGEDGGMEMSPTTFVSRHGEKSIKTNRRNHIERIYVRPVCSCTAHQTVCLSVNA